MEPLAYDAEDGTPRVIPVGFFWTGTGFVISTATTSPKVAALKVRPEAALAIDGGETPEQARAPSVLGRTSDQMARIAIVPSWVRSYDFGAGRTPRFLKELAERSRS